MIGLNVKGFEFSLFTIFTSTSTQTSKQAKQRENETNLEQLNKQANKDKNETKPSNMVRSRGNSRRFKVQMACKRIKL